MSDPNTTITIRRSIKRELEKCKNFSYEHWNDLMLRLIKTYKKVKNKNEEVK